MVSHGNVNVNGKRLDIASYIVQIGDEVTLTDKMYENFIVKKSLEKPTLSLPHFLTLEGKNKPVAKLTDHPLVADIPFEFEPQYFIEFCGTIK